jgi:hypothetical protein
MEKQPFSVFMCIIFISSLITGCSGLRPSIPNPPLKIVVGPVAFEAPVTKSKQIHSFDQNPDADQDKTLLPILIDEIQLKAQRYLTETFSHHDGFMVVPFNETRRLLADLTLAGTSLTDEQSALLADQTGADYVITGLIHDYGAVRWQYWTTALALHAATELLIVGFASGWNPAIVVPALALDIATDVPIWYGGAQILGWAFRPVRIHLDAFQAIQCSGRVWSTDEAKVLVPGKTLNEYPVEERKLKEVQLEANLRHATEAIISHAADTVRLQPCQADGTPAKIRRFSLWTLLDLLL